MEEEIPASREEQSQDTLKTALQLAALQEDSTEGNALRALLLGFCQQCSAALQKANSYHELILDELDARGGNTSYLEMAQKELSTIQTLTARIRQELPAAEGERLNLPRIAASVADLYQKRHPDSPAVRRNLEPTAFVTAEPFELQELLLHLMEDLPQDAGENTSRAWELSLENRAFSRQEASFLPLKDQGEYSMLLLRPQGTEPLADIKGLKPFSPVLDKKDAPSPLYVLQWCGTAAHNGAGLFYDSSLPAPNAVLIFPRLPEDMVAHPTPSPYRWRDDRPQKTILLVDDEDMIWDVLSDMLQDLGYQVLLAGDGAEAVEIYRSNPGVVDLVMLDMLMPNMGGRETFFLLKELDPDVKVLATSGYVSQEEIQDVMDAGAAGFLRKPYHISDLAKKIKEILGND